MAQPRSHHKLNQATRCFMGFSCFHNPISDTLVLLARSRLDTPLLPCCQLYLLGNAAGRPAYPRTKYDLLTSRRCPHQTARSIPDHLVDTMVHSTMHLVRDYQRCAQCIRPIAGGVARLLCDHHVIRMMCKVDISASASRLLCSNEHLYRPLSTQTRGTY